MSSVLYAIDTCSIVGAHKWYPKGAFGGVWSLLDELIDEGRLWVPAEVLVELEKHDGDPSHAWVKSNKDRCVAEPDDDVQASLMSQVLPLYPPQAQAKFAKERPHIGHDPWYLGEITRKPRLLAGRWVVRLGRMEAVWARARGRKSVAAAVLDALERAG